MHIQCIHLMQTANISWQTPYSVQLLGTGGHSISCSAASFQWREHVHDACWSQRSTHSRRHAMARAAGDSDRAVSDAADAAAGAASAPDAGLTDAGPKSHALTDALPGELPPSLRETLL